MSENFFLRQFSAIFCSSNRIRRSLIYLFSHLCIFQGDSSWIWLVELILKLSNTSNSEVQCFSTFIPLFGAPEKNSIFFLVFNFCRSFLSVDFNEISRFSDIFCVLFVLFVSVVWKCDQSYSNQQQLSIHSVEIFGLFRRKYRNLKSAIHNLCTEK